MKKTVLDNKGIVIRKLTEEDCNDTARFLEFINTLADDPEAMIGNKDKLTLEEEKEWLEDLLSRINAAKEVRILAEDGHLLIGGAGMRLHFGRSDHVAELDISILSPEYRNVGLGRAMMEELIDLGLNRLKPRPRILRVSAFEKNERAIALYRRLGFREVARVPDQYEFQGELLDEVIMVRHVA